MHKQEHAYGSKLYTSERGRNISDKSNFGLFQLMVERWAMVSRHGTRWSEGEMAAAVEAYVHMLQLQERGVTFKRSVIIDDLMNGALEGRSRKSAEFRFCNISAVLAEQGHKGVVGYKPLEHIGTRGRNMIKGLLIKYGIAL